MSAIRDDANTAWALTQQRLAEAAEALRAAQAAAAEAARLAAEQAAS